MLKPVDNRLLVFGEIALRLHGKILDHLNCLSFDAILLVESL
jgi:hypothetical protein